MIFEHQLRDGTYTVRMCTIRIPRPSVPLAQANDRAGTSAQRPCREASLLRKTPDHNEPDTFGDHLTSVTS